MQIPDSKMVAMMFQTEGSPYQSPSPKLLQFDLATEETFLASQKTLFPDLEKRHKVLIERAHLDGNLKSFSEAFNQHYARSNFSDLNGWPREAEEFLLTIQPWEQSWRAWTVEQALAKPTNPDWEIDWRVRALSGWEYRFPAFPFRNTLLASWAPETWLTMASKLSISPPFGTPILVHGGPMPQVGEVLNLIRQEWVWNPQAMASIQPPPTRGVVDPNKPSTWGWREWILGLSNFRKAIWSRIQV